MTETATTANKSSRATSLRASFYTARTALGNRGNLLTLILTSLFLLVIAFSGYFAADLVAYALDTWTPLSDAWCSAVFGALLFLFFLLTVMPLFLGFLRLARLMTKGETPFARELLYYMATPRRYWCAVLRGTLSALAVGVPLALAGGVLLAASLFANEIAVSTLAADVATHQQTLVYALAMVVCVLLLLLEGFALPVFAFAAKEEKTNPFAALLHGWRYGARHFGANLRFLWSMLWRAALSLCTLGILWLVWHGPLLTVAYVGYVDGME